ncbi:MAG: CRISPR-associated helicase Cas3' [Bacteroidota bacterium]
MTTAPTESWRLFWANTDRDRKDEDGHAPAWTRPLWAHLLDVGHTALLLWERVVPDSIRKAAADTLGMSDEEAGAWLSFWIGLHDLGKAIPSFQYQQPDAPYLKRMRERGFTLRPGPGFDPKQPGLHHGHATIAILYREQQKPEGVPGFSESLAAFVGFHHGQLAHAPEWRKVACHYPVIGDERWQHAQGLLLRAMYETWDRHYELARPRPDLPSTPDWLLGLAGWATLADWLGSYAPAFDRNVGDDLDTYVERSRAGAEEALRAAGFAERAPLRALPFAELFPELADFEPRPVQQALLDLGLPSDPAEPTLTIVEAPTGEGKTEAALALAARQQARAERGGGLYLALPTQATTNGLLDRATAFLEQAHPGSVASFRLAYGRSELHPASEALLASPDDLAALYDDDASSATTKARVRSLRWFLGRKRALLAPYGLGTIDQALLGVLYARHFFLRLYALAGKTVVVDEVHAYDTYMNALLERLLGWLRALGAHVILLSATLPANTRRALLQAWHAEAQRPDEHDDAAVPYPAVWVAAEGSVRRVPDGGKPLAASRSQRCALERGDPAPETVAEQVYQAVQNDAVVAVVCNTVQRAQDVFEAIRAKLGGQLGDDDLVLFHARFVRQERQRIETHVLERFGKRRDAGPAVLVGTQVIEQSLDLDVDLMLSDLAPIDLLLQRAGRLHRHDRTRPPAHAEPRLVWLCPVWDAGSLPSVTEASGWCKVYGSTVLWRTAYLLKNRDAWHLPADYRPLIEAVYGADDMDDNLAPDVLVRWEEVCEKEHERLVTSQRNAAQRIIPAPGDLASIFESGKPNLADDDDEQAHPSVKAFTREGDSVEVVVLHRRKDGGLFLDPDHREAAPLEGDRDKALSKEAVRALLGASVRLSQRDFIEHLRDHAANEPEAWRQAAEATPSLYGLHALVMRDRVWSEAKRPLRWDDRLGLRVTSS